MKRPFSLLLVAALFFLVGASAIWEMITRYSPGHIYINPLALCALVSVGLLRLRPFWRLFALVCAALLFLLLLATAVMFFLGKSGIGLSVFPVSVYGTPTGLVLALLLLGWVLHVLDRRDIRTLFSQRDA